MYSQEEIDRLLGQIDTTDMSNTYSCDNIDYRSSEKEQEEIEELENNIEIKAQVKEIKKFHNSRKQHFPKVMNQRNSFIGRMHKRV